MMRSVNYFIRFIFEVACLPLLVVISVIASRCTKRIDVGLGPYPLINNVYHAIALKLAGYSAETFVTSVYYITSDFDVRFDQDWLFKNIFMRKLFLNLYIFVWVSFRYRSLMVYFDGGPLCQGTVFLWRFEPYLYRLARVETIVLPYGSDVQVMSRSPNLQFKHAMAMDYPEHRKRHTHIAEMVDLWSCLASHIVGGCEWVDYMYHWDTLMLAHFSIQLPELEVNRLPRSSSSLKLLHAPNHRAIKGTNHLERAVEELRESGLDIELIIVERVSNEEVRRLIQEADVVVDQLIIGWYAMFAIEAMAFSKPVICHLRRDLEELYVATGLLDDFDEIPIIRADVFSIKEVLKRIYDDRSLLDEHAQRGRSYVKRHHSVEAIAVTFAKILEKLIGSPAQNHL